MQDPNRALFQLAHECVHLLDPGAGGANNLEEGLATHFSLDFMQSIGVNFTTSGPKYDAACALVRQMLTGRADAARELRSRYGPWRFTTDEQILAVCAGITPSVARLLAGPF